MTLNKILYSVLIAGLVAGCSASCSKQDNSKPTPEKATETSKEDLIDKEKVYQLTTTADRAFDLHASAVDFSKKDNLSPYTITLNPAERFQEIDGFGAAITGSTAFNLMKMTKEDRQAFLEETFSPTKGYGYSYVRMSIGCSDFSLSEFTCCDTPGLENFVLSEEDRTYVIPILKEILAINPKLKIMGSPWTPPLWMKVGDIEKREPYKEWHGGHLNPKYYSTYGEYFVLWIQALAKEGITIHSITPQNEPLNPGNSASCVMPWEEQRDFVKEGLGPQLKKAGLKTKVYLFDHNYNYDGIASQQSYPLKVYADAEASSYVAGAAYHNYGGDKKELDRIHKAAPEKELIFTETSIGEWNKGRDLAHRLVDDMNQIGLGTVNNWCRGAIVWNLMLDSERSPYRPGGCSTCYGAVDIDSKDYKTITRNSHYYVMAHLASVVDPGAYRIGTTGYTASGLTYSAFQNPDGSLAFVASNSSSEARSITVATQDGHFTQSIPSNSVVSFKWKK